MIAMWDVPSPPSSVHLPTYCRRPPVGLQLNMTRLRKADPVSDAMSVIRGYTSVYPLRNAEITALPILIACRLVCTCVLGAYAHSQDPENDYLLATQKPGWDALTCLVNTVGLDRAAERVRAVSTTIS